MGGRALLASEILEREEVAPKAWAKEGSDWGGWVAMRSLAGSGAGVGAHAQVAVEEEEGGAGDGVGAGAGAGRG